jgi:hypothetical protein
MWDVIAGGVITIVVAILFEWLRAPSIGLKIEEPLNLAAQSLELKARTNLRVIARNHAIRFFAIRSSALRCRGTVSFHDMATGQAVFAKPMEARWAGSPEPVPLRITAFNQPDMYLWDAR